MVKSPVYCPVGANTPRWCGWIVRVHGNQGASAVVLHLKVAHPREYEQFTAELEALQDQRSAFRKKWGAAAGGSFW